MQVIYVMSLHISDKKIIALICFIDFSLGTHPPPPPPGTKPPGK